MVLARLAARAGLAALAGLGGLAALAEETPGPVRPDPAMAREAADLRDRARQIGLEAILPGRQLPQSRPVQEAIRDQGRDLVLRRLGAGPDAFPDASHGASHGAGPGRGHRARYLLFASLGLPRGVLVRMIDEARGRGDMVLVFRGLPEGESLAGFARRLVSTESTDPVPLALDPPAFRDHGIDRVPAILDRQTGRLLHGTFFAERFEHHAPGALVDRTYPIAEPDLIAVLKTRAAGLDWAERGRAARTRAWGYRPRVTLAKAEGRTRRVLDLTARLARDVIAGDGTVIAHAGTRVDPARHLPFHPTLIVFDGRDPVEIAHARRIAAGARHPVAITTDPGDAAGFAGLGRLAEAIGHPVYLLDPALARRFALRATPSIIRSDPHGRVILTEGLGE